MPVLWRLRTSLGGTHSLTWQIWPSERVRSHREREHLPDRPAGHQTCSGSSGVCPAKRHPHGQPEPKPRQVRNISGLRPKIT